MGRRRKRKVSLGGSPDVQFDGPQRTGPCQILVIEQFAEGSVGTAKRVRNVGEHPLTLAHHREQISDTQYAAGHTFRALFERMGRSGRDSTQSLDASRSSGQATPFTESQVDAITQIRRIESGMGQRNYRIVRNFCGEGMSIADAIKLVVPCRDTGRVMRMQEALDDLDDALEKQRIRKVTL